METIDIILLSISSLVYLISMILNCLGVYLLSATRPLNSSKILLINLTVSEIIAALIQVISNPMSALLPSSETNKIAIASGASYLPYYLAMHMLTIDRLIGVVFPLKHRIMVTKRRLSFAILATWFLSLLIATVPFIFYHEIQSRVAEMYLAFALDVTYIILCSVTYGLIFIKLLERKRLVNNQQDMNIENRRQNVAENGKFFKITALIILSFLLFLLIPNIVFHLYHINNKTVMESMNIAWSLGFVADPIIYIFLQDNLRLLLKTKLCTCKKEVTPESDNNQQDTAL